MLSQKRHLNSNGNDKVIKKASSSKINKEKEENEDLNSNIELKLKESNENNGSRRKYSESLSELEKFGVSKELVDKLHLKGIKSLFEVQQKVYFPLINGENVIVSSLTGSGKTLSFVIPILEKCMKEYKFKQTNPMILVIAPTRELAVQISGEFDSLASKDKNQKNYFKVATIYGGVSIDNQKYLLRGGADVVVGTPGRIIDLIDQGYLKLDNLKIGVLDEVDKMFDMGFQENIVEIFEKIYKIIPKIQVCLFSATIHKWVIEVAKKIFHYKDYTFINLVKNLHERCPIGVEHLAVNCLRSERISVIADLSKKNFSLFYYSKMLRWDEQINYCIYTN